MSLIYEPNGRAREYSPLALNVYVGGCPHGCGYCYCRSIGKWSDVAKPRNLSGLEREAEKASQQILLSFMSDPYGPQELEYGNTRAALKILKAARCSVAILSKGGPRMVRDLETFASWPQRRIKVGATLTFFDEAKSIQHEPGAAMPMERLNALMWCKRANVKTWASVEPVIDCDEAYKIIEASLFAVDQYKIGVANHVKRNYTPEQFSEFLVRAIELLRKNNKQVYVKIDTRKYAPAGFLTSAEIMPQELEERHG